MEDALQTVGGLAATAAATDAGIVDHHVEWAGRVRGRGERDRRGDVGEVANDATRRAGNRRHGVGRSLFVPGVQNNVVAKVESVGERTRRQCLGRNR